jgi:hypothetical protein
MENFSPLWKDRITTITFQDAIPNLGNVAPAWMPTLMSVVQQEFPNQMQHLTSRPEDRPTHPAFYGCFDWHSSVEMHRVVVRLVSEKFDEFPALDSHMHLTGIDQMRVTIQPK